MILQALYDYYQRKAADPESNIAPLGYEWKEIPFILIIDKDGKFINLEDTRQGDGNKKIAHKFLVIKTKGRSGKNSWQISNILWDHYGYVLKYAKDESDKSQEDAQKRHKTFIELANKYSEAFPENEQFLAVKKFLGDDCEKQKVFNHPIWPECSKIPGCNMSFRLIGESKIAAENKDLQYTIEPDNNSSDDSISENLGGKEGICLITGERGPIAVLHHSTSIPGGKSGGKLVGFQKNSGYDSYYKEQGLNAPVSMKAEDAYTTALNVLLGKDSHNKIKLSDMSIVFWAERKSEFEEKFSFFFTNPDKDDPDRNSQEIKALYSSFYTGKLNTESSTKFYILGMAPNSARIAVKLWKRGTVKEFAEKFILHFSDLDIQRSKNDREYFSLFSLLSNIAPEYKMDNLHSGFISSVISSIIEGTPYPSILQQQCIRRIRADRNINRVRAAILKAYLNRKNRIYSNIEKEISMALDISNTNQGYLCGRLFAVLEKIQEEAQPGINATIKDRYYGAASSTPVTVFGRLLNLSHHHLVKLNPGRKINFEKLIGEITAGISSNGIPAHLSLDDQSRFAIGYYHQRQDFFINKEQKEAQII